MEEDTSDTESEELGVDSGRAVYQKDVLEDDLVTDPLIDSPHKSNIATVASKESSDKTKKELNSLNLTWDYNKIAQQGRKGNIFWRHQKIILEISLVI